MNKFTEEKRTDKHEPTPLQVLRYIADFMEEVSEPMELTLRDIRLAVIQQMAEKKEYFTSDYRHSETQLHEAVYNLLGGTVSMNLAIEECQENSTSRTKQPPDKMSLKKEARC